MVKFLMNQKLKQDDGVTDQSVNQPRTTENNSERAAYRQRKFRPPGLFDTRAEAHVMPKYVWEQLGGPSLQTT